MNLEMLAGIASGLVFACVGACLYRMGKDRGEKNILDKLEEARQTPDFDARYFVFINRPVTERGDDWREI